MATVLLVDDSMYQRIKIRKYLEAAGHGVIEAKDGKEGLDMAEVCQPDCIVLDLLMPDVDGMDVLRGLRDKQLKFPVIVHTADVQEQTRQDCLAYGAVAFLNKPSQEKDVLAAIANALASPNKES
jgi:two-component system, chemotaxis family, chemotaxis protein CheY